MDEPTSPAFAAMLHAIWSAAGGDPAALARASLTGSGSLPSVFAVSDLAAASVAAAGLAVAEWVGDGPAVTVDRRLASFWFATSLRPEGWAPPPPWDPIAGDYLANDGWIRLHTNAPAHRAAALAVLAVVAEKPAVAAAVAAWSAAALETAIVAAGGCAAEMRSLDGWRAHLQGRAVAAEPLIAWSEGDAAPRLPPVDPARPLAGIRVLDLTRVLAGPVATRFLAGYGAEVLRIDPPDWEEPGIVPEVLLGKRSARLDLRSAEAHDRLLGLLADADILVHGYRPDALERLGLGETVRRQTRPGLIDIALDAYGWTGPWAGRRGFDSLVQMSVGIAEAGMRGLGRDRPTPLPVQALDHATGYMMATAAVRALTRRRATGSGWVARLSLARTGALLAKHQGDPNAPPPAPERATDLQDEIVATGWGPAGRLLPPVMVEGAPLRWDRPATPIGGDPAVWESR